MSPPSAAAPPRARYIQQLLQIHTDDLAFVWGQRCQALHSNQHTQRDFAALSERVEAHVQGLLCAPPEALLDHLRPGLSADDGDAAFAAAYALLRTAQASPTQTVLEAFGAAEGTTLRGLRDAMCLAPHAMFAQDLRTALKEAAPATAAAAAAVLASHGLLQAASARLALLLEDADPATAALAWRAALLADRQAREAPPARPFRLALSHADAAVRDAGWAAVVWSGQAAALPTLRKSVGEGDDVALRWLAALGTADDVAPLQRGTLAMADGTQRCAVLARHGHPGGLNALVRWMDGSDTGNEAIAVAAGEAFELITGIAVQGERRQLAVPADADDFTHELAPLVWIPDAKKARLALEQQAAHWAGGLRWRRGLRVDRDLDALDARALDMQARWDLAARAALAGGRAAPPPIA